MKRVFLISALLICLGISFRSHAQALPLPAVPDSLRQPPERAAFILEHFWDQADFAPGSPLADSLEASEQAFVDFVSIIPHGSMEAAEKGIASLLEKAGANPAAYRQIRDLSEKYLYELESPLLSEPIYRLFLLQYAVSPLLDEAAVARAKGQLELVNMNRPGSKAADFRYTDRNGAERTLYETPSARQTLLVFYNPTCDSCEQLIFDLQHNPNVSEAIKRGEMSVVAIYSGPDRETWSASASSLPESWTVGYEPDTLEENDLYDFRATPTIFLLDNDKNVIIKDLSPLVFSSENEK